jgi:ElaB/YqjD/DUF883 family membrane-anchored ribosome-binding protein
VTTSGDFRHVDVGAPLPCEPQSIILWGRDHMGEQFTADPPAIAGYATLVNTVREQISATSYYVDANGGASRGGFDGLMSFIRDPVNFYAHQASIRLINHGNHLYETSNELKRSAWVYSGTEESNYEIFADDPYANPNRKPRVVGYKDYPGAMSFPVANDPVSDLQPPDIAPADIKKMVDDLGGSIQIINDAVHFITGWYPVQAIVEPLSGNWNALSGAGEALTKTGDAVDAALGNLTSTLPQLDPHWNGGAAQSFTDYINRLVAGASLEGPLNRLVGDVYGVVAKEIEKVAEWMVKTLKTAVDKVVAAAATSWIPGYGWVRIIDAVRSAIRVFQEAAAIVEDLRRVIDTVNQIIEIARDPAGALRDAAQSTIDEKLAPIKDKIEQYQKGAEVAADIGKLATAAAAQGATPTTGYTVGDDPRRAGA